MGHESNAGNSVLIVSQRQRSDGFGRQPGYVAFGEAEDVLAAGADADMAMIDHSLTHPRIRARRLGGRVARRVIHDERPFPSVPGFHRRVPLTRDHYDLAVFIGFTTWDLPLLERMTEVRERADRVVAWFPEAWVSDLDDDRVHHEPFGMLNALFVGNRPAAERLSVLAPCPVHHLPPAVDVDHFSTLTVDDPRPIDVLGIGRRDPRLHRALVEWSRKTNRLYIYDTVSGAVVSDAAAHRANLGDLYRRTNIAITNFAKWDLPEVTRGYREIPGRLWEALAAGAVMVGKSPGEDLQLDLVGDIIVNEIPEQPSQAVELIHELAKADTSALRRAQVRSALLGHDWSHRWAQVFNSSGLDTPVGLQGRLDRLEAMAASIKPPD